MGKTQAPRDMPCLYLKTKLKEPLINNALDKHSPHFEVIYLYIYILRGIYLYTIYIPPIYLNIYDPMNIYVFMCKIHTNSKEACIMRERL